MRAYTVAQLAERWGCSDTNIYNMVRAGDLRAFKAGKKLLRITTAEVERVEGCVSNSTEENGPSSANMPMGQSGVVRLAKPIGRLPKDHSGITDQTHRETR